MKENLYQAELINSLKVIQSRIGDYSAPFMPKHIPRQDPPVSGFQARESRIPAWRLAGGMVNSLTQRSLNGHEQYTTVSKDTRRLDEPYPGRR